MSESYTKLIKTLQTIFEMDKADLDFGIYRIMNQKRDEINRFLEMDLLPQVKQAFADYSNDGNYGAQVELDKLTQTLTDAGMDPEQSPKVIELRQQLATAVDVTALENDVFSKLHTLFSRYYDKGDFISQRRYKADTYAIPYEGEEVKLYWANHDQYYIKSSEHLRDYAFLAKDSQDNEKPVRIKLVEADTEKDNVKAKSGEERRFVIDEQNPLSIEEGELLIHFNFLPVGKKKQADLNKAAVVTVFEQTGLEFTNWLVMLQAPAPTEKDPKRTILEKHLNDYTSRNTFDYFIHKDLGGFLNRELDFYIKNEVMHLDDIDDTNFELTQQQLRKIKVLRTIAQKIIRMLAQIEDFQKKLWLKKKFVVETNYCITLDRVPESLYSDVIKNIDQIREWVRLGFLEEGDSITEQYINDNSFLPIDTAYFGEEFKGRLLAMISNVDDWLGGLIINSENSQALNLILPIYNRSIDGVYIDPPYNTDASSIAYKNNYKNSSWIALMHNRILLAKQLQSDSSNICVAIDDIQFASLKLLLEQEYGSSQMLGVAVVRSNPAGRSTPKGFAEAHDYALFSGRTELATVGRLPRSDKQKSRYSEKDDVGDFEWVNFRKHGGVEASRKARPRMFFPLFCQDGSVRIPDMEWDMLKGEWVLSESPTDNEDVVFPIGQNGDELRWKWGVDKVRENICDMVSRPDQSGNTGVYIKSRMKEEGMLPVTWWESKQYSATEYGTNLLKNMFGRIADFSFPKSIHLVEDCLRVLSGGVHSRYLDFFGGSGTTAHAVLNLNRQDDGDRKYILVEMGGYFDQVLMSRLKKAIYSREWKDGKPKIDSSGKMNGVSHCFKYIRLESYEDALGNLIFQSGTDAQVKLIKEGGPLKEDYTLGYWLDLETADSPSLLNIEQFEDPFNYKLNIGSGSVGATKPTTVDLVETFNYLIGLTVKTMDVIRGFKIVTGTNPKGESVLVVWRNVKEKDNAALEEFLDKQGYNPRDTEFENIYVNGDHTLEDPCSKVNMTEIEFKRLMFDVKDV